MKVLVWLFKTPWTVAHQAPLSMGFSGKEYWSGLPFSSPGDPPNPGIKPGSPGLQADSLPSEPPGKQPLNKFHPIKSIFVNSEPQEMWTEDGKWQLSFLSPFNSRTLRLQESANQTWASGCATQILTPGGSQHYTTSFSFLPPKLEHIYAAVLRVMVRTHHAHRRDRQFCS